MRVKHGILAGVALAALSACSSPHHRDVYNEHSHHQQVVPQQQTQYCNHPSHYGTQKPPQNRHHSPQYVHVDDTLQQAHQMQSRPMQINGWQPPVHTYRPVYTHKLLGDYAEQITMKLVENMRYVTVNTPVAVASFVDLDSSLGRTNILGNQLAESFITELQEFGVPVVDFKTTGVIHVGDSGDFVFSRKLGELARNPHIKYILSGTMTYNDRGVILNVRMVDINSKVVVASSKGFVPQFIVESLYPRNYVDGIVLDSTS
ncbi:hypothetical protein SAMN05216361_2971 [Marisediminitalea aggregata]|uniref:FlgO domain-containing protein n=2 Tax=Marisediminitalea TaxID=2662254 RepID=A0A1M5MCJ7_9ALTE|nr:FlgO family outer membrane protein [Marisediminitalea aggregata]SHG74619.1 hypothetical protein SAMN05216361_2971 [Marisediminitalea aggregata]